MPPAKKIRETQHDQDDGGNDGADNASPLGHAGKRAHALESDESRQPIDRQYDAKHELLVGGKRFIPALVGPHESQRHRGKSQGRRKPNGNLDPEHEHGQKGRARPEGLADPAKHAALFGPACRQLGRHQRNRHQEGQGGEHVIEDGTQAIFGLGRQAAQTDHGHDVHDRQRTYRQLLCRRRCGARCGCRHDFPHRKPNTKRPARPLRLLRRAHARTCALGHCRRRRKGRDGVNNPCRA